MQLEFERSGHVVTVQDPPLAVGGEANLYAVPGTELLIVKVYHDPNKEYADKLSVMIATPPDDPMASRGHPSIAWPIDRLITVDDSPRCVGFVMPRVANMRSVFEYYNPKTRRKHCPLFHYRYLIRTARNLAAAFRALHERGYVVGDVNESNLLVSETALTTLVDTDSFQVSDGQRIYRSPVGKPEFTPPELQGVRFRDVDRNTDHDKFGLAVLIFLLLMEGIHPFSGRRTDEGDAETLAERISAGYFPYGVGRRTPYEPMPFAPPIGILHPDVRALMRKCFENGHAHPAERPDAATWQVALDKAEHDLTTCRVNAQHVYRVGFGACPWCERMERLGGWDPYPSREAIARGDHFRPVVLQTLTNDPTPETPVTPVE
ncbi:MAG: protein kinase domain-containing protein [Armatimonadota bacterium]